MGKMLIGVGAAFILFGLIVTYAGKLPGDIVIEKEPFTFYFPITTSILLSVILSLFFYLYTKFF
jgi:hypothetical protein